MASIRGYTKCVSGTNSATSLGQGLLMQVPNGTRPCTGKTLLAGTGLVSLAQSTLHRTTFLLALIAYLCIMHYLVYISSLEHGRSQSSPVNDTITCQQQGMVAGSL